jgi:hypothetical protein
VHPQPLAGYKEGRQTKVDDLHHVVTVKQDVLELHIPARQQAVTARREKLVGMTSSASCRDRVVEWTLLNATTILAGRLYRNVGTALPSLQGHKLRMARGASVA